VVAQGSGVAVRADAMAIWIPTKPASEYISTVTSVDITVDRPGAAPTVRRTLTGAPAQHLAAAIDALRVDLPGIRHCPMDRGFTDKLLCHTATGHTIDVITNVGDCGDSTATADGTAQPTLSGGADRVVTDELGLPSNYGS
jgi:hypothetical protein